MATLENGNRLVEVALLQVEMSERAIRHDETERVIHILGDPHRLLRRSDPLPEFSRHDARVDQPDAGEDRGQPRLAEALADLLPLDGLDVPQKAFRGSRVVAQTEIRLAQTQRRHDLKGEIRAGRGYGKGAMARSDRPVGLMREPKMGRLVGGDPSQPPLIANLLGKRPAFAEVVEDSSVLGEWEE